METQFITDTEGHKTKAIISMEDYNHFIELLEEENDCNLYDEAKKILVKKPIPSERLHMI